MKALWAELKAVAGVLLVISDCNSAISTKTNLEVTAIVSLSVTEVKLREGGDQGRLNIRKYTPSHTIPYPRSANTRLVDRHKTGISFAAKLQSVRS